MSDASPSGAPPLTHVLVDGDLTRARDSYSDVVGATILQEYGGTSCVLKVLGAWLLLVTGGRPTEDKPGVAVEAPRDVRRVSHAMTLRVADCAPPTRLSDRAERGSSRLP